MFSLPVDSARLVIRLVDCIDHLRLFPNDRDACQMLHRGLEQLATASEASQPNPTAGFAAELAALLAYECAERGPEGAALQALKQCLDLLSWQVELSDPQHGLTMDCSEQRELLATLALSCKVAARA
ncbi:hypothetical protein [Pseudomonas sp. RIT-PI-S]|uniref:hypothetical protein n=1 Tax=Pseudomonas sp. RIT-PI-S TaxID=3035295 RepID=UPI0021DA4AA4|nr:hypothetical protein [Pseudomonas sp. RIT-PI-S]